jgi:hypothetical protein
MHGFVSAAVDERAVERASEYYIISCLLFDFLIISNNRFLLNGATQSNRGFESVRRARLCAMNMFATWSCIVIQLMMAIVVFVQAENTERTSQLRVGHSEELHTVESATQDATLARGAGASTGAGASASQLKEAGMWISTWYALEGNYVWATNLAPRRRVSACLALCSAAQLCVHHADQWLCVCSMLRVYHALCTECWRTSGCVCAACLWIDKPSLFAMCMHACTIAPRQLV